MRLIDDYLAKVNEPQKSALVRVRRIISEAAPGAVETIGYGMPVFKYNGKYLIGFAAFKNHMSIFPGGNPVATTMAKLAKFKTSKGTIQFTIENPIPDELLIEIVSECLKNIPNRN
jgi:uncharacterized protein YdhG (YjbR/CyaY superfamily)